jgi:hypothetical protein
MVLSPGEDGVYGATTRTGGELFEAVRDYVALKGGSVDVLPGKSRGQLRYIIAATTFDMAGSDDLVVGPLDIMVLPPSNDVIRLDPISSVGIGEPLMVNGTANCEDGTIVMLFAISGPWIYRIPALTSIATDGSFNAVIDTTDTTAGTYVMQAEDENGNADVETFVLGEYAPTPTPHVSAANDNTINPEYQRISVIESKSEIDIEVMEKEVVIDVPCSAVIGENVSIRGMTSASGDLDIVIDDILMADDLPIDSEGEFEWEWNTEKPLPNMGAYTSGPYFIKVYVNCHVAKVNVGDNVRTEYKHLDVGTITPINLLSPWLSAELDVDNITKGDCITVQGTSPGADGVDIVIIGPEGLKELPDSFTLEAAIADGLYFTSAEVTEDSTFEKRIKIPEDADSGDYLLLVLTPGRDSLYALTTRDKGELFAAVLDYGWTVNDLVGCSQEQLLEILRDATFDSPGSDDLAWLISFKVTALFDTKAPANPYPSIMGNHTGTIKPNHTVTASKLYTYPCVGTGGHTEYARIGNKTWNATATWKGYAGDWHNITFDKTVVLLANKTDNYTIRTGSYPQIHHTDALPTANGWVNCTKFTDANGKVYYDWIPAIRLWA